MTARVGVEQAQAAHPVVPCASSACEQGQKMNRSSDIVPWQLPLTAMIPHPSNCARAHELLTYYTLGGFGTVPPAYRRRGCRSGKSYLPEGLVGDAGRAETRDGEEAKHRVRFTATAGAGVYAATTATAQ